MSREVLENQDASLCLKFGGSSVDQQTAIGEALGQFPQVEFVVYSAPKAKQPNGDKATDIYIAHGVSAVRGHHDKESHELLRHINEETFSDLGSTSLKRLMLELDGQLSVDKHRGKGVAWFAGVGEYISAMGGAMLHGGNFVDSLIVMRNKEVDYHATYRNIALAKEAGQIGAGRVAFGPGFYAIDETGNRVLLGRGGSDRSGAIVSLGLETNYWNMTDVDGIYSGNPNFISGAVLLGAASRLEVREGAHGGSGVLQGDTIMDLEHAPSMLLRVRSTTNLDNPGTLITDTRDSSGDVSPVIAISGRRLAELKVDDLGMAGASGYLARVTRAADDLGIALEHSPSAQDGFDYTVALPDRPDEQSIFWKKIEKLENLIKTATRSPRASVEVRSDRGVVYLVGDQLKDGDQAAKTLIEAFSTLLEKGIKIGTPVGREGSPSLAILVKSNQLEEAQRVLHEELIEKNQP